MKPHKKIRILAIFMALLGTGLALFLTYEYYQPEPITCPISASDSNSCEAVRQSKYGTLLGVKTPVWGTLYFAFTAGFLALNVAGILEFKKYSLSLVLLTGWGLFFESIMTGLQIFEVKAICMWCVMVYICVISVFVISSLSSYQEHLLNKSNGPKN